MDDHRYHGYLIISLLKPLRAAAGLGWQQGMTTGTMDQLGSLQRHVAIT